MYRLFYGLLFILLFSGCDNPGNRNSVKSSNQYAHGFEIETNENYTKLTIFNPWEKADNVSLTYHLADKNKNVPDTLSDKRVIKVPVERVICLSTTHLGFLDVLGEADAVIGISGSRYVTNENIRKRMDAGLVPDVGYGQNLNFELIISQKPELVIVYGVGSEVISHVQKLEELGIPVILAAEYLEETPLGKAEWIKFFATLFQKERVAGEYFDKIEEGYNNLKKLALQITEKPKILVGSPYKDSWWIPGGNSYLANLITDAGGDYLGKSDKSHESYVISFENALTMAAEADVWINMSALASKKEILDSDGRFKNFGVFKNGRLFNNIKRMNESGGNDFWESGTVNPHLVLNDLIAIFHPGLTETEPVYYLEIK